MILYKTPAGVWTGTQADARASAKEESGDPKNWVEVNVPVDKAGLMAFLNTYRVGGNVISVETVAYVEEPRETSDDDPWGIAAELEPAKSDPHVAQPAYKPDRATFAKLSKTDEDVISIIGEADRPALSNYFDAVIYRAKELMPS